MKTNSSWLLRRITPFTVANSLLLFLVIRFSTQELCAQPKIADSYRAAAQSFRTAAARAKPENKGCLIQWADYYDCLASQLRSGASTKCQQPGCKPDDSPGNEPPATNGNVPGSGGSVGNTGSAQGFDALSKTLTDAMQKHFKEKQDREDRAAEAERRKAQSIADQDLRQTLAGKDSELARWQRLMASESASADQKNVQVSPSGPDTIIFEAGTRFDPDQAVLPPDTQVFGRLSDLLKTEDFDRATAPAFDQGNEGATGIRSQPSSDNYRDPLAERSDGVSPANSPSRSSVYSDVASLLGESAQRTGNVLADQLYEQVSSGDDVSLREAARQGIRGQVQGMQSGAIDAGVLTTISNLPEDKRFDAKGYYDIFFRPGVRVLTPYHAARNLSAFFQEMAGRRIDEFLGTMVIK